MAAAALGVCGVLAPATAQAPALPAAAFTVDAVAEGIHLFRPAAPDHGWANSLVVERADGLLVVDAQPTPEAARALLAQIAERWQAPVRFLVLSHPHAEAAGGASAFGPNTVVIAAAGCAAVLADPAYDFGAEERAVAPSPERWQEPERPRPTLVIRATADLADALRPVILRVHPRAHSQGDLTVLLPDAEVLYVGGLLPIGRNPYGGDADVRRWLGMLNSMVVEPVRTIVGIHGRATDTAAVLRQRDAFAWLRGRVEEGFVDRLGEQEIVDRVLGERELGRWFDIAVRPEFIAVLAQQVVAEAAAERRKRGIPLPVSPAEEAPAADDRPAPGSS